MPGLPARDGARRYVVSTLRLLLVEDSEDDAALLLRALRRSGYTLDVARVETQEGMIAALDRHPWDVVISDYYLPRFSAIQALAIVKERRLDLPFIIVSGAIGEETAAAALRAGAHDVIRKGNWVRLPPAIDRELRDVANRRERRRAEEALLFLAEASKELGSSLDFEQ